MSKENLSIEEARQYAKSKNVVSGKPRPTGGQHVGIMDRTIIVDNETIGVRIEMNAYTSQHTNRAKALLLIDLIIDDVIK